MLYVLFCYSLIYAYLYLSLSLSLLCCQVDAFYPEDKQWYPAKIEMVKIPKLQKGKVRYHVVFAGYAKVEQKLSPEFIRLSGGRIELGRPSLKPGNPLPPPLLPLPPQHPQHSQHPHDN